MKSYFLKKVLDDTHDIEGDESGIGAELVYGHSLQGKTVDEKKFDTLFGPDASSVVAQ